MNLKRTRPHANLLLSTMMKLNGEALMANLKDLLEGLRITDDSIGTKKIILHVSIRKPRRTEFIRVRKEETYSMLAEVFENDERTYFFVASETKNYIKEFLKPFKLCLAINRHDEIFLWPIKLSDKNKPNKWLDTAMQSYEIAKTNWVRIASNMTTGAYETVKPLSELPEPSWPDLSFEEILNLAFKNQKIDSPDHPEIKKIRGDL